jgi:hypothetical protein
MSQLAEFIDRYVSIWNERDAGARRRSIAALWAPDGATCYSQLDSRGYDAIEARVAGAHEKWVRDQGFVFRPRKSIVSHHNVLRFYWEMVPAGGGEVAAAGLIILILGPDGRIHSDYQFREPPAPGSPSSGRRTQPSSARRWSGVGPPGSRRKPSTRMQRTAPGASSSAPPRSPTATTTRSGWAGRCVRRTAARWPRRVWLFYS